MMTFTEAVKKQHAQIVTPALIVNWEQVQKNIFHMQKVANENHVVLRPHFKTHKSLRVVREQIRQGAKGITVAKVGEAEILAAGGITDIFIANQIVHPITLKRLAELATNINLSVGIDDLQQLAYYESVTEKYSIQLSVLIEINSGLDRCGVLIDEKLVDLAREIERSPNANLAGIFTHAGQAYGADSVQEVHEIARHEAEIMDRARELLIKNRIDPKIVSVGSTPTASIAASGEAVNEIRPGNYVFYDAIQQSLGSCIASQSALFVLGTVISRPQPNRVVIDAGSKALNLDQGAHGKSAVAGHGAMVEHEGLIERLSEEHGVVHVPDHSPLQIGDPVLIVPNHACTVMNLFDKYYAWNGKDFDITSIDARGKSQ